MFHLRRHPFTAVTAVLVLALVASVAAQPTNPTDLLKRLKAQFAPDTRLAVFDVKAEQATGKPLELQGEVDQAATRDGLLKAFRDAGFVDVVDKVAVLPDPALGPRHWGIVTVSVAVMKTMPSHSSELGNQLLMGSTVKVLKKDADWFYVQSRDDKYLGWMHRDHVALMTREQLDEFSGSPLGIVTALFTVVREEPRADAAAVTDAIIGNVLKLKGQQAGWSAVQLPDGRSGFVDTAAVADYGTWKASRQVTPDNIEKTARQFMGVPYLWGGTSAKGFDCSGFAKTVFRLNGVELLRDADQQSTQGEAVTTENDFAQLRKGDLVFFGPRPGVDRITHVGIYLGGKLFIHCLGMVRLNSFDPASPIYSETHLKRLVKVRRIGA